MAMLNWAAYLGHEASIVAALREMRAAGTTVDEALAGYDAWLAEQMADMIPATAPPDPAETPGDIRSRPGQADAEHRLGACPVCSSEVWGIKKCPHIAPPWRTFFACDNDDCAYHGKSRLTVEALRRKWPEGAEVE